MLELKPKAGFCTDVENMGGEERGGRRGGGGEGGERGAALQNLMGWGWGGSFRPFHEYFACG